MAEFNNMTIMSAARILEKMHTQAECDGLEVEWGLNGRLNGSVIAKVAQIANIASTEKPIVFTIEGRQSLAKTMIIKAVSANEHIRIQNEEDWQKMNIGLRLDGFEIDEERTEKEGSWGQKTVSIKHVLRPMMPEGIPGTNVTEAENEIIAILKRHGLTIPLGHLQQAINNFSSGSWASANSDFRSFFEGTLNEIAVKLGCLANEKTDIKRRYLGTLEPPFLYEDYNEWNANIQKPQYLQGLWSRLHPHGSHPGLSEEDDCTFRMQITLISVRLFLRRFDKRMSVK